RGGGSVTAPQGGVRGIRHGVGSDKAAIEAAIASSRKNGAMALLPTLTLSDARLNVTGPDVTDARTSAEVWLFGLVRAATIAIGRGEDKGRTSTYDHVVRRWMKLCGCTGRGNAMSMSVQTLKGRNIDEGAVLVQSGTTEKPKAILGAALAAIQ